MATNLLKYARTNKSLIMFSNVFNHLEVFEKFYNLRVKPKEFGYVKIVDNEINLLEESLYCDLYCNLNIDNGITTIRNNLLNSCTTRARYILTSSRFIIFPTKFRFKRVANRIFNGFIIQGAGEILFKLKDGKLLVYCMGEAKELNIKSRKIDSEIIQEDLEANF